MVLSGRQQSQRGLRGRERKERRTTDGDQTECDRFDHFQQQLRLPSPRDPVERRRDDSVQLFDDWRTRPRGDRLEDGVDERRQRRALREDQQRAQRPPSRR